MKSSIARFLFLTGLFSFPALSQRPVVELLRLDGTINPASSDFIHSGIERSVDEGAQCLVIQLNTPGGLLKSTRVIVTDLLNAPIPVVVYVSPGGSQAASAGVFVTLAAHIAAMAPGTNIGAAHPVTITEGQAPDSVMMGKITNDAAAFIRTIAEKRSRNVQWADEAVRKSVSITETEALKQKVVDYVAKSVDDLLRQIDGKEVDLPSGKKLLAVKDAEVRILESGWRHRILEILSDPNIAYILLMLGFYGLLFELYNPGSILPGIVGVISIILAFYSLHTLPVNYAGLALIVFALILFIAEIKVQSHGLLAGGGILSLALGSVMLIDTEPSYEFVRLSWSVIIPTVVLTAGFFLFAIGMGIRAQRRKPTTGREALLGEVGVAIDTLNPDGQVKIHGEIWNARSVSGKIHSGKRVKVLGVENLRLTVTKADEY
jgi:membrane-bound serine protease (ClpP class)